MKAIFSICLSLLMIHLPTNTHAKPKTFTVEDQWGDVTFVEFNSRKRRVDYEYSTGILIKRVHFFWIEKIGTQRFYHFKKDLPPYKKVQVGWFAEINWEEFTDEPIMIFEILSMLDPTPNWKKDKKNLVERFPNQVATFVKKSNGKELNGIVSVKTVSTNWINSEYEMGIIDRGGYTIATHSFDLQTRQKNKTTHRLSRNGKKRR